MYNCLTWITWVWLTNSATIHHCNYSEILLTHLFNNEGKKYTQKVLIILEASVIVGCKHMCRKGEKIYNSCLHKVTEVVWNNSHIAI
jgi:small-conductance mechanosensitive channel